MERPTLPIAMGVVQAVGGLLAGGLGGLPCVLGGQLLDTIKVIKTAGFSWKLRVLMRLHTTREVWPRFTRDLRPLWRPV